MAGLNQDELAELQENELEALRGRLRPLKRIDFASVWEKKKRTGQLTFFVNGDSYLHGRLSTHHHSLSMEGRRNAANLP
jgi:hypothetical protein